jgi:hypothetical protein
VVIGKSSDNKVSFMSWELPSPLLNQAAVAAEKSNSNPCLLKLQGITSLDGPMPGLLAEGVYHGFIRTIPF